MKEERKYIASQATINTDLLIRNFLKQHGLYEMAENLTAMATDRNLKGPVPVIKFRCPECGKGTLSVCKDTFGFYRYCCCAKAQQRMCDVFIF